ncbi:MULTISPECIES: type 4a pilus biogenesis protein PilO [unclassified Pseudomonas]|uniref:type 4a pilus biogenesis protein PilO n=1 Tax=unclassified Pseudomonas TaxID=196821 RepID=UPI00105566F8|nr:MULTISPECIES: type 4a pilus biogenesis protein PilO [unclassified Pseudomonas]MEC4165931.1 type 4a pilus biogenesis protein PilO [Pseudomonas sp. MS-1(2024)]MEC4241583.1 type 4a pilus biogenesis protein PilO [Pseudomonas sp. DSV-1]
MAAQWLHSLRSFDLRELDLGHPGVWSPKRKNLVALAWLGMILALGYPLLLQPSFARLQLQHEAQARLKAEFESRVAQVANLDAYLKQMQGLEAAFGVLLEQLPAQAQVPGLLDEISRLSHLNGLVVEHIEWLPEVLQPFYAELPLQMTLAGGYHELGLFVSAMASLPRIVTLHDFALAPLNSSGSGQLRMTLLARAYRTHDQGLIP